MSALPGPCGGVVLGFAGGRLKVRARPSEVPPDQLASLRRSEADLLPILAAFGTAVVEVRPASPWPEPGADRPPVPAPRWPDLDALRDAYGSASGVEGKRGVVAAWALAAGGRVGDGALLLPPGLANSLTLATLKTYARCVGLPAGELACSWCPNPPLGGDVLCDACRWLAGGGSP